MAKNSVTDDLSNADPEEQIVSWINHLGFTNSAQKIILLKKIQELLFHQYTHLLSVYLDDIMCYVADRSQEVKRVLVGFIEEISIKKIDLLPRVVSNLQLLLTDVNIIVQKRVIQAASIVYKNAFAWMCSSVDANSDKKTAWDVLNHIKLIILNMVDSENEGIRTNSIKFLEGIIILQTYRDESLERKTGDYSLDDILSSLDFIQKRKLEEESNHIFNLVLKFHNSQHISGVNLMACMSALCEISKLRPKFLPKVVQAFSSLYSILPPSLSQSQVNSVKKHLKMQVINLLRHPSSCDFTPQLLQVLQDLGMTSQEIAKIMPKGDRKHKRVFNLKNGEPNKRIRVDSPLSNSQSSEKSDASAPDVNVEDSEITEKTILEGLKNIEVVVNLVVASMVNLPEEFPPHFKALYEPISNSGVIVQHSSLAKLLIHSIKRVEDKTPMEIEIPVAVVSEEDERTKLKNALAKLESSKIESKIESALSKIMEDINSEESARDKEIFANLEKNKDKEKQVCPPTPTIPKLKQRIKSIKLQEVTKPLTQNVKERLICGAVDRMLKAERSAIDSGASSYRIKMLTTFAVNFGDQVRDIILSFILDDIANRLDLALSWMYEEYCYIQGFSRKISGTANTSKMDEKSYQNYNNLLCTLITDIAEISDPSLELLREKMFRRVYLEAPLLTGDAINYLREICLDEEKYILGLDLLKDLITYQPTKSTKYISALLPATVNKNFAIREAAIERVVALYKVKNESMKKAIDKHTNLHLGFIALPDPPKDLLDLNLNRTNHSDVWDDDLYKVCLQLCIAILPYNEELFQELCRIYIGIGADGKRCVLRMMEAPVKQMGADNHTLLSLIEECPKGAETLITRIIHILTERTLPTQELVNKVRSLYAKRVPDVRFLIPVLTGLTKNEIFTALPKLIKLNPIVVKEAFSRLWSVGNLSPVTPAELLVALHLIDLAKAELKFIIKATSLCFSEKQAYTSEVLEDVLQELVDQPQLPVLLMRSALQALSVYPTRLPSPIISILHQLIIKHVWEHKVVWEGFLKCVQRLMPQSLNVVTMLPIEPLRMALKTCPDIYSNLATGLMNMTNIPTHVASVMAEFSSSADEPIMTIGNEIKGNSSLGNDLLNEPLPPGMD